jgi:hypothetical protein
MGKAASPLDRVSAVSCRFSSASFASTTTVRVEPGTYMVTIVHDERGAAQAQAALYARNGDRNVRVMPIFPAAPGTPGYRD